MRNFFNQVSFCCRQFSVTNIRHPFCVGIDKCGTGDHDCHPSATCTNHNGGFFCTCLPGFMDLNLQFPGTECEDINECLIGTHNCDRNAICTNTPGGYTCECNNLYRNKGIFRSDRSFVESTLSVTFISKYQWFRLIIFFDDFHIDVSMISGKQLFRWTQFWGVNNFGKSISKIN